MPDGNLLAATEGSVVGNAARPDLRERERSLKCVAEPLKGGKLALHHDDPRAINRAACIFKEGKGCPFSCQFSCICTGNPGTVARYIDSGCGGASRHIAFRSPRPISSIEDKVASRKVC
jgi:hypothetical protein